MIGRGLRLALAVAVAMQPGVAVFAGAFNFQEPADWNVGDPGSTYNNWEATIIAPFQSSNSPSTEVNVNPEINATAGLNVQSPGFVPSSGGYYSFNGNYGIFANTYNHGGSAATTSDYLSGHGTRVIVQTAATTNPDFDASIFENSIELVKLDGSVIAGGTNAELLGATEIFRQEGVETPFGPAEWQELLFEFYLPEYSGDFRIRFTAAVHSSFQELRVDTLLVAEEEAIPGDFDGDGDVDSDDLADWQAAYGTGSGGDADGDSDTDGRDFLIWQQNYTGSGTLAAVNAVPEPTSLMVVIFGIITGLSCRVIRYRDSFHVIR